MVMLRMCITTSTNLILSIWTPMASTTLFAGTSLYPLDNRRRRDANPEAEFKQYIASQENTEMSEPSSVIKALKTRRLELIGLASSFDRGKQEINQLIQSMNRSEKIDLKGMVPSPAQLKELEKLAVQT